MDNQRYFFISGLISLSFFILFLALFVIMLFNVNSIKSYGFKKKKFISVSIDFTPSKSIEKKIKSLVEPKPVVSEPVKKEVKQIDVKNLFSDVWTQKIDKVKKIEHKLNSKRISEIQKQIKLKKTSVNKISTKTTKAPTSSATEVNEYLAKIQSIVYQHFNVPPNTEGNSVKSVIELDPFGKMIDFRILTYSSNEELNKEVDKIKNRLVNVVFPVNPQHKSSRTTVILISKE